MPQDPKSTATLKRGEAPKIELGGVDITEAKNNIKPFSTQVKTTVEVTGSVPIPNPISTPGSDQALQDSIGNQTNNAPIQAPRPIFQPVAEEEPNPLQGFSGSSQGAPLVGLRNPNDGDINYNGILDTKDPKYQVTTNVTGQQVAIETSGNYQPGQSSAGYRDPKQGEIKVIATNTTPTKSGKPNENINQDHTQINQWVENARAEQLEGVNGEKLLTQLSKTRDTINEKVAAARRNPNEGAYPDNYYEQLVQYASNAILAKKNQIEAQKASLTTSNPEANQSTLQSPPAPRSAPIPFAPSTSSNPARSKNNVVNDLPAPSSSMGSLLDSAPVPTTDQAQGGLNQPSETSTKANSAPNPQNPITTSQPNQIPGQGKLNPNPEPEDEKGLPGTVGYGDTGDTGQGNYKAPGTTSTDQSTLRPVNRFDSETRDSQAGPFFNTVGPNGELTRNLLPNTEEFQQSPDFQGKKSDTNEVAYQNESAERQAYLREQAQKANQEEQARLSNDNDIPPAQKEEQLRQLKKGQEGLEQAGQSSGNPAGNQKSKLQQAVEGKLQQMILKPILAFLAQFLPVVIGILLFVALFITVLQTLADAYYCKNGVARAVATAANSVAGSLLPGFKIISGLIEHIGKCEKESLNSANSNCGLGTTTVGSVIVSGCLTKAIEGKADNDVLLLWRANGTSPIKDSKLPVSELKKVMRIFGKAGLSQKDTDDSIAFVIGLMATESGGRTDAWDLINGREGSRASGAPNVPNPLYCLGVAQMCPDMGIEGWAVEAGVKLDNSKKTVGYGLIDTEENYVLQAKVINSGRKDKLRMGGFPGKSDAYRASSLWLGSGGCDINGTCPEAYGQAAENNYQSLFASCLGQPVKTASKITPQTYASLDQKLREAILNPISTVSNDWKFFNPLGSIDGLAQSETNKPVTYNGTPLSPEALIFLDGVAKEKGYKKFTDAGAATPNFLKALTAMMSASGGKLKIIVGQVGTNGYRSPSDSIELFLAKIDPADRWKPGMDANETARVLGIYKKRAESVAPPFWSEHTAGIAVDFDLTGGGELVDTLEARNSEAYKFLQANKAKYGFTESYPQGTSVGAGPEPWHWRFDGNTEYPPSPSASTTPTVNQTPDCAKPGATTAAGGVPYTGTLKPGSFIRPIPSCWIITSPWSKERWGKPHKGIDIGCPSGTPVVASKEGEVVEDTDNGSGYGSWVVLKHPDGSETLYGHNSVVLVKKGQQVKQGQNISLVGSTGFSTGPHLHFEIRPGGVAVDPCTILTDC